MSASSSTSLIMRKVLLLGLFLTSCFHSQWSDEVTAIIQQDAKNKRHELLLLEEIANAEINDDMDAFKFFFEEYIKVQRLNINEDWKEHPEYIEGGLNIKY